MHILSYSPLHCWYLAQVLDKCLWLEWIENYMAELIMYVDCQYFYFIVGQASFHITVSLLGILKTKDVHRILAYLTMVHQFWLLNKNLKSDFSLPFALFLYLFLRCQMVSTQIKKRGVNNNLGQIIRGGYAMHYAFKWLLIIDSLNHPYKLSTHHFRTIHFVSFRRKTNCIISRVNRKQQIENQ